MTIEGKLPRETTVLVTGITGFLAGHIVAQLLQQGYRVRGSLRDIRRRSDIERKLSAAIGQNTMALGFVEANLDSDDNWDSAVAGCDYVIHTASPFPYPAPEQADDLIRSARDGALRVLKAAHGAGVQRVVMTSSISAINRGAGQAPFTEDSWTDVESPRTTAYYKSKTVAEKAAWDFARTSGLDLAVINPSFILGPLLGAEFGTSVGLIHQLMTGKLRGLPHFGFSIVDVRDVADAHLRAMIYPDAAGHRFIVGGSYLSLRELRDILAHSFPSFASKIPNRDLPNWLVRLMAYIDPKAGMIVHDLGRDLRVNSTKARSMLGWQSRPEIEAIRASAQSLIDFKQVAS